MTLNVDVKKGDTPLQFLKDDQKKKYYCCKINGITRELTYVFQNNEKQKIQYLDLTASEATRIFNSSIRYLIAWAVREVNPKLDIKFFYNVSRSIFCKVINPKGFKVTHELLESIKQKAEELVDLDIPFIRTKVSKEEALGYYKEQHMNDKIKIMKYRPDNFFHLYIAKDEKHFYVDYMYDHLVPSSGYLKSYLLRLYNPGFIIQVPRSECAGTIPPFNDENVFATTLTDTYNWASDNELATIGDINRFIKKYDPMSLINLSESRFNNMLSDLGREITHPSSSEKIRLICVAGPSSSGKTSFANRLLYELMARGLRPVRVSIDDFYIPKDRLKPGTDIESMDSLDVEYFNDFLIRLLEGEEVDSPSYDFKTGIRLFNSKIKIDENQPVIIEGIHALNPKMTETIPDYQKYKVYIAPQPQVNLDDHTPVSMTDMRLARRIARDSRTRGSSIQETIKMWPNVRAGEFNYIYPTQEYADFVFDSFLPYEPCALKDIIMPQLETVLPESIEYSVAHRLYNIFKYFVSIPFDDVPCNSLLREFIGGTSFKDAR